MFKNNKLIISIFLSIVLSSFLVNAFGITLPYTPVGGAGQITAEPGQVLDLIFNLQNGAGEDMKIRAAITKGQEIAKINGPVDFKLPKNTKDILVPVTLTMPKDAVADDTFQVILDFNQVIDKASGTSLTSAIGLRINIKIYVPTLREKISRVMPFENKDIVGYLFVLILLIVIIIFVRKNLFKKNS